MVSSLNLQKCRSLTKKQESAGEDLKCAYDQHSRDVTRDEIFPTFCRDVYFAAFPPPMNVKDRKIDDNVEIDPNQFFKFMSHVGSGRLGKTYRAQRVDMTPYAVTLVAKKDTKLSVMVTKTEARKVDYVDMVRAVEPFTLRATDRSAFLARILVSFRSSLPYLVENYFIVCEFWPRSISLCHRLQEVGRLSEEHAKFYITELVEAVASVHKYGKIFRRLCPCSLMIDCTGHLKLVPYTTCDQNLDCGQSCNMLVKNCGDQFYAAPEVVFGVDVTPAADWWSVGVILFQLLAGELPFTGRTLGDLGKAITENPIHLPEFVSGEAAAFLRHILHKDPRRRLGFADMPIQMEQGAMDVKDHPFFQHVLWRSVRNVMETPPFVPVTASHHAMEVTRNKMKALALRRPRQTNK